MSEDKKPTRRKAAELRQLIEKVEEGQDIIAAAAGAKNVMTFEELLNNHEVAKALSPPAPKRGRPTKYEPDWMLDKLIEMGRLGASKDKMASAINVHIDTMYEWEKQYPEFSEALKSATQLSKVWWENAGQVSMMGLIEGYRDTTWIFNMKNRFPETYRDVKVTELNNKGAPLIDARSITINARDLDPEARENLKMALLAAKRLAGDVIDDD